MGGFVNVEGNKKAISQIFANVNGQKKEIVSGWANKNGVVTQIYSSASKYSKALFFYTKTALYRLYDGVLESVNVNCSLCVKTNLGICVINLPSGFEYFQTFDVTFFDFELNVLKNKVTYNISGFNYDGFKVPRSISAFGATYIKGSGIYFVTGGVLVSNSDNLSKDCCCGFFIGENELVFSNSVSCFVSSINLSFLISRNWIEKNFFVGIKDANSSNIPPYFLSFVVGNSNVISFNFFAFKLLNNQPMSSSYFGFSNAVNFKNSIYLMVYGGSNYANTGKFLNLALVNGQEIVNYFPISDDAVQTIKYNILYADDEKMFAYFPSYVYDLSNINAPVRHDLSVDISGISIYNVVKDKNKYYALGYVSSTVIYIISSDDGFHWTKISDTYFNDALIVL